MAPDSPDLPVSRRIASRIIGASFVALIVTLIMVSGTLWLSWQLEGSSAAINDTGSLRMRSYRLALTLDGLTSTTVPSVRLQITEIDSILTELEAGNPARPLMLPTDTEVRRQYRIIRALWQDTMRPAALQAIQDNEGREAGSVHYRAGLENLVQQADRLVRLTEQNSARKTDWLRLSQAVLIVLAVVGTVAITYLLYLWIIRPVSRLQQGLMRVAGHEFDVRLPVESQDEFGQLTQGFNNMAEELSGLYRDLEMRVQKKTAQLAAQNRELSTLYDMAAFLSRPDSIEALSQGFLHRVVQAFAADGGSLRLLDPDGRMLHLTATEGLSGGQVENEHCLRVDGCFCGSAIHDGVVMIRDMRHLPSHALRPCEVDGFVSLAVFQIVAQQRVIGSFSLHYRVEHSLDPADNQLLQTLGQHLGAALENLRLQSKEKQLAVAEERHLVSQGLHDSLAQSLNFLNLQVQMLERELAAGKLDRAQEHLPLLRAGVEESYQDVRELLANFRSRLETVDLQAGLADILARFQQQTGIETTLDIQGDGPPLPPEQQLQILFILQEALSNVRKHAGANKVGIRLLNERDFNLEITDDGQGFDPDVMARQPEQHYGLRIMHERAERLQAQFDIASQPGQGTRITLTLGRSERVIA